MADKTSSGYTGAPSAGENAVSAVKEVLGLNRKKTTAPAPAPVDPPKDSEPDFENETQQLRHTLESESQQASNAGRQAQSTDHMNSY